jgi:DNA mismatch repair ATPase MutS
MAKGTPHSRPNSGDGLTPSMRQYVEQKAAAPYALLLFRMGEF